MLESSAIAPESEVRLVAFRPRDFIERIALGTSVAIAGTVLAAWIAPRFAQILPAGWAAMKCNTSIAALLSAVSLFLAQPPRPSRRMQILSRAIAAAVFLLSASVLLEYLSGASFGTDALLAADSRAFLPGRMSPQTAIAFWLLGGVIPLTGHFRGRRAWIADCGLVALLLLLMTIASGYFFGALQLFGLSMGNRVSVQTLSCITLLTLVILSRRTASGFFAILRSDGIGGKVARHFGSVVLLLPFLLEGAQVSFTRLGVDTAHFATALSTSLAAVFACSLVLTMAWHIDSLEKQILELSLRDDLTKIYNRKGFLALASEALEGSRRERTPFSVLFIDLDNLKWINDKFGHDAGSAILVELASLLTRTFDRSDVIARIGGDEFVVAARCSEPKIALAAQRLHDASERNNTLRDMECPIGFSCGHVTSETAADSLEHLLGRADLAMYSAKRDKKMKSDANRASMQP